MRSMESKESNSFNIAVTGHRFIPDELNLHYAIRQVLRDILKQYGTKTIYLYSALAEGSDQLVAKLAQEITEMKLLVPLPMEVKEYLADFATKAGRTSFQKLFSTADKVIDMRTTGDHQDSYEALGYYLANQADILLALWNGVYNQKKGGTSEVVKAALQARKPVYWIYCPNEKVGAKNIFEGHKRIGDFEII